jgi:hypothetical protein
MRRARQGRQRIARLFFRERWLFRGKRSFGLAICLRSDTLPWSPGRKRRFRLHPVLPRSVARLSLLISVPYVAFIPVPKTLEPRSGEKRRSPSPATIVRFQIRRHRQCSGVPVRRAIRIKLRARFSTLSNYLSKVSPNRCLPISASVAKIE